jgi:iron complex transport system permease protein
MTKKLWTHPLFLILLPLVVFGVSLMIGRYPKPGFMPLSTLLNDQLAQKLVFSLRLPRLLSALLLGMALSAAGGVMQMLFRNPLVEPGFLGVSQGAGFGAALSIIFLGSSPLLVEFSAAFFAMLGLITSYYLARHIRFGGWILRLILSGIVVSAIFSAGLGILKYLADPTSQLPEIVFWLLGGLYSVAWRDLLYILPVVIVGLVVILLMRWRLNLLALGDETAASLGVSVRRERLILLFASVAITAVVISVAGIVGWIGLIIPQIARRLTGANSADFIPLSISLGGAFGMLCDLLARTVTAGEIPLGIITSLIGSGIFVLLMVRPMVRLKR